MTLQEACNVHAGALALNHMLSRPVRGLLRSAGMVSFFLSASYSVAGLFTFVPHHDLALGLMCLIAGLLGLLWLAEAYFNTYYFLGFNSAIGLDTRKITGCTFEVADMLSVASTDLAQAFAQSALGAETLLRVGIPHKAVTTYLAETDREAITAASITIDEKLIIRPHRVGLLLLQRDRSFSEFLAAHGVFEEQFIGALRWVQQRIESRKRIERWWSKDNLSQSRSLGSEWSYGQTYYLDQFSKSIRTSAVFSALTSNSAYAAEKVAEIENALARDVSANVILIGEPGVGKADLVLEVARRIQSGRALQAIANQHVVMLDTARIFAFNDSKKDIEATILHIFSEAEAAGNIILVIENIATFMRELASIEVHLPELIDRYLASDELHVIVTATPGSYHADLEPQRGFTRRFQEILIDTPSTESTVRILASMADTHERAQEAVFTYQALIAIATAADRYLTNGVMPDKAVQLMADVYADCVSHHAQLVTEAHVYKVITAKTGIPTGPIKDYEKEKLLKLEDILHSKVIGQNNAISAIARTMRRARAGIQASDRPIGTFLFLGPTGVGKTETAKALAEVFFNDTGAFHRLDMSEFSDASAVTRLIGTVQEAGKLSSLLQEHPYCVLLLDEFEKSHESVHDLFLQILDEGVFTDGRGNRVNARNAIIIATSNAGSALIMQTVHTRKSLSLLNSEIVAHIINAGIFKPELINRFDSAIIFEPLMEHEQAAVAELLLADMKARIKQQGYVLELTRKLMQAMIEKGYSPDFGARPMRRLLQDLIEEKVASKIIAESLPKGSTITLDIADFTNEELAVRAT